MIVPDPRDPSWGDPPFPDKITAFRPAQLRAIDEILWRFEWNTRIVVLDAPTGSGKTLVGEAVRRQLATRALYMCVDRGLQRQFRQDFTYARTIMGRANYPTLDFPDRFRTEEHLSCDDCTATSRAPQCQWCHEKKRCPYTVAKREALEARLACANTAYFMSECNWPGNFSGWPLVIADEGDRLEDTLMSHVEITLSRKRLEDWYLTVPEAFVLARGRPDAGEVAAFLDQVLAKAEHDLDRLEAAHDLSVQGRRAARRLANLIRRVNTLQEEYPSGGWVVQAEATGGVIQSAVVFKPVKVDAMANGLLWDHGKRWLVMSATVLDASGLLRDLGILDSWAVVRMPSSFPVANRPVKLTPVADVTAQNMDYAVPAVARELVTIMDRHPYERILVHTVSYKLANQLRRLLPTEVTTRCVWLEAADARPEVLAMYLARPDAVLIAPALERGLDLPDDACRVVVVCKLPFPNLGDPQIRARMDLPGGRQWYTDKTLRSLVQMTGRGVRHADDWCVTYILDKQIERVLNQYSHKLPSWWLEAVC